MGKRECVGGLNVEIARTMTTDGESGMGEKKMDTPRTRGGVGGMERRRRQRGNAASESEVATAFVHSLVSLLPTRRAT